MNFNVLKIGEHIPDKKSEIKLSSLKEFVSVASYIDWYKSKESKKIFPIYLQEISELNPKKSLFSKIIGYNPFFDHSQIAYFIAKNSDKPVGRIAAYIDYNYSAAHGKNIGWIGLFESINNRSVAFALFDIAIKYLTENDCRFITGPAKYNANGEVGLLVSGFEFDHYFMEPYNPPYYQDFFVSYGFKKESCRCSTIFPSTTRLKLKIYMPCQEESAYQGII